MAKKNKPSRPVAVKSEEETPKTLTASEFDRLELHRLMQELRAKERECVQIKLSALKEKRRALELMARSYDLDEMLLTNEHNAVIARAAQDKEKHEALLSEIRERLGLEGRFGYNPDTLEVSQG